MRLDAEESLCAPKDCMEGESRVVQKECPDENHTEREHDIEYNAAAAGPSESST